MSIETRIQAINDHLIDNYKVLRLAGADLTGVDKNIVNLKMSWKERLLYFMNNGTQEVWDSWDKVNGSGTTLSLNNTEEAPMSLAYKGNTYQYSTRGKNLLNTTANTQTKNGLTFTRNEDDTWTINGTSTAYTSISLGTVNLTANTTYTLSGGGLSGSYFIQALNGETYPQTPNGYITFTQNNNYTATIYIVIIADKTLNNVILKPMIELGSSVSEYEPYTGGIPAPNPDFPEQVHVVSGDNEITISGKNLLNQPNKTATNSGITLVSTNGEFTVNGTATASVFMNTMNSTTALYLKPGTYTLSANNPVSAGGSSGQNVIRIALPDGNVVSGSPCTMNVPNATTTFTVSEEIYCYLQLRLQSGTTVTNFKIKPQLEKNSTATTYEPYQGRSYEINLGKNLSSVSKMTTVGGGYINSSTGHLGNVIAGETYTLSFFNNSNYTNHFTARVYYESTYADQQSANLIANGLNTFTFTASNNGYAALSGKVAEDTTDLFTNIQLEKGSVATSYAPYFTPIELCKIGTYQDKIAKSTGKNLFDSSTFETFTTNIQTISLTLKPNTTYTMSTNIPVTSGSVNLFFKLPNDSYSGSTNGVSPTTSRTLTTDSTGVVNIGYRNYNSGISGNPKTDYWYMLNKGTTATEYEPYGTDWYLKKEIGKVVLNGSESGYAYYVSNENYHQINATFDISNIDTTDKSLLYCSHFEYYSNSTGSNKNQSGMTLYNTSTNFVFSIPNALATSVAEWKTWLSSNNTTVYYPLATPTYETITDTTLISQLEEAKKSYESQTNISQENNDMPFELDVVALGVM